MVLCYSSLKELRQVLRLCKIISFLKELLFLWWPHKENWLNGTWKLWYHFCNFLWVKLHYNKTYRSKLICTNIWATVWTQVANSQPLCPFVQRSKPSSPLLATRWQFPKSPPFPACPRLSDFCLALVCPLPLGFWSNILFCLTPNSSYLDHIPFQAHLPEFGGISPGLRTSLSPL